jgi:hypothetical protein
LKKRAMRGAGHLGKVTQAYYWVTHRKMCLAYVCRAEVKALNLWLLEAWFIQEQKKELKAVERHTCRNTGPHTETLLCVICGLAVRQHTELVEIKKLCSLRPTESESAY